ncbi:MAG: NAD-binding protein, partial [Deltaproteobacteria bacterium]|nr:NAD-binding protein [Deltaproteobacteria bacterium]
LRFVRGQATSLEVLERACLGAASHAILLAPNPMDPRSDDQNLAAVLTMEHINGGLHTVCEVVDAERVDLFYRAGADSVVCLANLTCNFLAQELLDPGVQRVLEEITHNTYGQQIYIAPVQPSGHTTYAKACELLQKEDALALGIARAERVLLNPSAQELLKADDRIVCLAATRPTPLHL